MLTYLGNDKSQTRPHRTVAYLLLSLTFLWAFLCTIDGPAVNFGIDAGAVVYKVPKALDAGLRVDPGPLAISVFPEEPARVHASFLLFDFKQNLRRWPNVAGDISRSPPFFVAL